MNQVADHLHDDAAGRAARPRALRGSPARATIMLVATTLLWGLSFPLMKSWQEAAAEWPDSAQAHAPLACTVAASATLIAVRMVLALVILGLFRPQLFRAASRREHACGVAIGCIFFAGFTLQVLGLTWTTPALSAFFTSLGSAWVPLLAWLWWRTRVAGITLVGLALGMLGVMVLAGVNVGDPTGWALGRGEGLTYLSAMIFAVEILVLDRLGRTVKSAHLTVAFMGTSALAAVVLAAATSACTMGLTTWTRWIIGMFQEPAVVRDVILLTVFSTVLAFHWMNVYQPLVPATRAALIYLLEPVFGSFFSILLGHDQLTLRLALGGAIILGGNLLAELPSWLRARRASLAGPGMPPVAESEDEPAQGGETP
jgi:drug/metabolite transporter (DMT)-like permease